MRMFAAGLPPTVCEEDTMALLKRTSIVLFANRKVFVREPSAKPIPVKVFEYPKATKSSWSLAARTTSPSIRLATRCLLHQLPGIGPVSTFRSACRRSLLRVFGSSKVVYAPSLATSQPTRTSSPTTRRTQGTQDPFME